MKVLIPFQDELIYAQDKEMVYRLGGRWSSSDGCYIFEQSDIEAWIMCELGQWYRLDGLPNRPISPRDAPERTSPI